MTREESVREHYRQQGRQQEQERIIKMLEVLHPNVCYTAGELIALIKGENK